MLTFGVSPECQYHDIRDNLARLKALEDAGFDYIWEGDHTLPWHHSAGHSSGIFTTLTAFLERTESAVVGGMVIAPLGLRHHPIDIAMEIATQGLLYPGRVALCVGTGEAMNVKTVTGQWPPWKERAERVVEAIELIRKAWESDDYFQHDGKHFNSFFYLYSKAAQPIPLLCAANGPRMAKNAGLHADGYVAVGVTPAYHHETLIPAFEEGATAVGRNPDEMMRIAWVSTAYHPDLERALEPARLYGALVVPELYHDIYDPRVIEQRSALVPEEALFDAFCIATDVSTVVDRFQKFIDAGCNHVIWADMSPEPALVPEIAKEVLDTLRERNADA